MPLSKSQQKTQLDRAKKRLAKAEAAATEVEALRAEITWLEAAPTVADKPKRATKKVAAAPAGEAPASA